MGFTVNHHHHHIFVYLEVVKRNSYASEVTTLWRYTNLFIIIIIIIIQKSIKRKEYNTIQYNTKFVKRHVAVASEIEQW